MLLYLDTSALVKRYINEIGSDAVRKTAISADLVAISVIGKVEMHSALSRSLQYGVAEEMVSLATNAFKEDYKGLIFLNLHNEIVNMACETASMFKLRGFDAIHLATALFWMEELGKEVHFFTYDRQLWHAAQKTKLVIYPEYI